MGGLRIALFLWPPMPLEWSGVASAPDGRHGLLMRAVSGIMNGTLRRGLVSRPKKKGRVYEARRQTEQNVGTSQRDAS
ncbi:hypothetical protein DBL06_08790 [Agrobacterium pusense]|nr:hypothetical protein DBL06_08790 [Agrobacterium pusense]